MHNNYLFELVMVRLTCNKTFTTMVYGSLTVMLPSNSSERVEAIAARRKFAGNTFSDHMIFLRAFQVIQTYLCYVIFVYVHNYYCRIEHNCYCFSVIHFFIVYIVLVQ